MTADHGEDEFIEFCHSLPVKNPYYEIHEKNEHSEIKPGVRPCPLRGEPMSSQMKAWWAEQFRELAKKNVS